MMIAFASFLAIYDAVWVRDMLQIQVVVAEWIEHEVSETLHSKK